MGKRPRPGAVGGMDYFYRENDVWTCICRGTPKRYEVKNVTRFEEHVTMSTSKIFAVDSHPRRCHVTR